MACEGERHRAEAEHAVQVQRDGESLVHPEEAEKGENDGMTRIEAVREAIRVMEKKRREASADRTSMKAAEGMEEEYERANETVLALKEICQALQAESVKKSIAKWQMDLIEDPESVKLAMSDLESR